MNLNEKLVESFLFFLQTEKGLAKNTIISYKFDLVDFLKFLVYQKIELQNVTYLTIINYFESLIKEKDLEPSSQIRKISVFFNFYDFLCKEHGFTFNPVRELERPIKNESLPIFLEIENMKKLLETAKSDRSKSGIRDYAVLELLYSTGMRISECLNLKIDDILNSKNKVKNSITILGKGEKERIIFINQPAVEALQEYIPVRIFLAKDSKNKFLFLTKSSQSPDNRLTRQNFFYSLKGVARKAGLNEDFVSPHKIRHSFATHMFLNGIDIRILQEMLGHSDVSTTQIYTHINSQGLKKVVNSFHPLAQNELD